MSKDQMNELYKRGIMEIAYLQKMKVEECYKSSKGMDEFINCYKTFSHKVKEENTGLEMRLNWVNSKLSECIKQKTNHESECFSIWEQKLRSVLNSSISQLKAA